ncbi:MAG: phosphodiester glycosidase family protein [Dysgonomonas sp.]|nr:phosphodiester glycosidase family protein [Dysgonomonas sp.]
MRYGKYCYLIIIIVLLTVGVREIVRGATPENNIISYIVDPKVQNIDFYWKDDKGDVIGSLENLKLYVESQDKKLLFAANGGMYNKEGFPQGLFIQQYQTLTPLDTTSGQGNFYLKPNGVFYICSDDSPVICRTEDFLNDGQVKFATQSGPMLVIDGELHSGFKKGSPNLHIRNGVGILPDNSIIFAMSKSKVNFYDFASYFKSLGCKNALYLDGYVSRTYLPEKNWIQMDGNFSVIIGVTQSIQ